MVPSLIQFTAYLLIVGCFLRVVQAKWPDSTFGKATAFIY